LKQQIGGVRVVGEVSDLVNREKTGSQIGPQAMLERAGGFLPRQIQNQIGGGEEAGRVAGQDRFVDQILGDHRLAEAVRGDDDYILPLREKVQREHAFDGRSMNGFRVPIPSRPSV